jgi:hypothetical protein
MYVRTPLSDLTFDRLEHSEALPDLTAALGAIPGGLGAELAESFTFAGQQWTSVDAHAFGTPIGLQLAMEQRGRLGAPDAGHPADGTSGFEAPGVDAPGLDGSGLDGLEIQHVEGEPMGQKRAPGAGAGRRRASV